MSSWLDSNSKKPSSYRHLHCFGVQLADLKKKGVVLNSNSLDASGMNIDSEVSDAHSFMKTTKCDHGSLGFQVEVILLIRVNKIGLILNEFT